MDRSSPANLHCISLRRVALDHFRQQVEGMPINRSRLVEDGCRHLRVVRARWDEGAAAPAPHQQVLHQHFFARMITWEPRPEREASYLEQLLPVVEDTRGHPGDLVEPDFPW